MQHENANALDRGPGHPAWQSLSPEQSIDALGSRIEIGLSSVEAVRRLVEGGENKLAEAPPRSPLSVLLAQFRSVLTLVLVAAAVAAGMAGAFKDTLVIGAVVVLNSMLGFYQEYRAERSLVALRRMVPRTARVRRDGTVQVIPAEALVPGDILLIEAGERITGDGRVILSAGLQVDESGLTGESQPVAKEHANRFPLDTPIADQRNMVFLNTIATRGRGEVAVTATGMATAMGRLSRDLAEAREPPSPLQRQLDNVGKRLGVIALALVAILCTLALARGEELLHVVMESISLAVAAIPEGLPAVVTVTLALGMHRMARKQALVKRLASVETLGCTTVICSDKTGTLTVNQMTVRSFTFGRDDYAVSGEGYSTEGQIARVSGGQPPDLTPLLMPAVLCNDSEIRDGELIGDPTEGALLVLARKAGTDVEEVRRRYSRIAELPFDSAHKFMATAHRIGEEIHILVKGAPDVLLARCDSLLLDGTTAPLDETGRTGLLNAYRQFAGQGLRGLLLADTIVPTAGFHPGRLAVPEICKLRMLGLVGIMDPPRPEAREAIAACGQAGITVKMITGDHPDTAAAIARDLGLEGCVMTGAELEKLPEEDLSHRIDNIGVFARVAPEHKVRIVRALQAQGHIVAMTGDGVNDAPALKSADIGVAMGQTGTEVAKEAATMILTNDNFATIVSAVGEGRALYDNIVKFVRFQLSTTIGAIMTVFSAPLLGFPDPLAPIHILWVAMIMDGPPAVALALDSARPSLMHEPPRRPGTQILSAGRLGKLLAFGVTMTIGTLAVLRYGLNVGSPEYAVTLAFTTFVFFQVFNVFNARAEKGTSFNRRFFDNGLLWLSLVLVVLLQALAVYWRPASQLFGTVPLAWPDLGLAFVVASSVLFLEEARKTVVLLWKLAVARVRQPEM